MKALELETKDAGFFKVAAYLDARMKSLAASSHYSDVEKIRAERMRLALNEVYSAKCVYVTFRKKFIVVKLDSPTIRDRKNLRLLEQDYESEGITKVSTAQGITYRIPKNTQ
jgi:hypothetical protein